MPRVIRGSLAIVLFVGFLSQSCASTQITKQAPLRPAPGDILAAVEAHDAARVQALILAGGDPKERNQYEQFPLSQAAYHGDKDVVLALLQGGAPIRDSSTSNFTALMSAAMGGHLEVAELLMDWGVARDAADKDGLTALDYAARFGNTDIRAAIVKRGVMRTQPLTQIRQACGKPITPAQAWALAAYAGLDELNGEPCACLGGSDRFYPDKAKKGLESWWSITDHQTAVDMIKWLDDEGHHKQFEEDRARTKTFNLAQIQAEMAAQTEPKRAARLQVAWMIGSRVGEKGILGWDLSRLIWVASHSFAAGYITEVEAWAAIMPAACKLQATFNSWVEFKASYLDGRYYWNGGEQDQVQMREIIEVLIAPKNLGSPWNRLSWSQDLGCSVVRVRLK